MRSILAAAALLCLVLPAVWGEEPASSAGETPGLLRAALAGPLGDVDEIVYAVRGPGREWHFYANFGYVCQDPGAKKYGTGPGMLCALSLRTGQVRTLLSDPDGGVRDPEVHYSGEKILFSYRKGGTEYYHLYEINIDGTGLRQLTDGPWDDMECCYAPDGSIIFTSSRCRRYVPCLDTQVAVLYRCESDGSNIRQLSPNVENECTPAMLQDGRVIYMRWEYVNRGVMEFHHLWTMRPDGTGQMVYYGNMYDRGYGDLLHDVLMTEPRPVPGTDKVSAIFSDKHGKKEHVGHVFMVDAKAGPDALGRVERVSHGFPGTPEPEPGDKPDVAWRDPYPFGEDCFLVASLRSLYVMDGQGRFEKVHELPEPLGGAWIHEPRPLVAHPREHMLPDATDWSQATGTMVLENVYQGRKMDGVEPGTIEDLLVLEILPTPVHFGANTSPIGDNSIKRILGTVPVAEDGSAFFEVPARRALCFLARDAAGRTVKIMNSFTTALPGEQVGCVGCHEPRSEAPLALNRMMPAAMERVPEEIRPVEGVPDIIDFNSHIQPILDRRCVRCHDGTNKKGPNLNGERYVEYSNSYRTLSRPDHVNIRGSNRDPYSAGSSASKLVRMLQEGHGKVKLAESELETIRLWIDSGAVYAGTYGALSPWVMENEIDRSVLEKRCYSCHVKTRREGRTPEWPFKVNEYRQFNMTKPEKSGFLMIPLAGSAGGRATSTDPTKSSTGNHYIVFEGKDDPDYRALVQDVKDYIASLEEQRWYGTPNWQPNRHYIREMKRYGVLPREFDPATRDVDAFELDRKYYDLFYPEGQ
jgi:hypothetical protein